MNGEKLAEVALDIGAAMLTTGGEVTRVEDTIKRIGTAYGCSRVEVFSVTSLIIVTLQTEDGEHVTQTRRVPTYTNNLGKLERLNALSRYMCEHKADLDEVKESCKKIMEERGRFFQKMFLGYALVASSFAIQFGGNILDGIAAGFVSVMIYFLNRYVQEKSGNKVVYTFICSFIVGLLSIVCTGFGMFSMHADMIMIGNIMLLIPGISFMNSVKDMVCGDTMTGMLRLMESVLTAIAIGAGFALSVLLLGQI